MLGAVGPARADDPLGTEFDQLDLASLLDSAPGVWAASKTEQSVHEAPAIVTTVTREQITVWGYRSVSEILSTLLGFYVVDDHAAANLAVRGISGGLYADSSIVKVLIDGHSVAFHSTGGNWLGPELVPLSAIDRIEIVRGPASALFGADAFLGVINIHTRPGKSLGGGTAWLGLGRSGDRLSTDVDVSAGLGHGALDFVVAVRRNQQDLSGLALPDSSPAPTVPPHNHGARHARGLDQRSWTAIARLGFRPRAATRLGLFAYVSAIERGAEFGSLFQLASGTNAEGVFSENRVDRAQARVGGFWDERLGPDLRLAVRGQGFRGGLGDDERVEVGSEFHYVRRDYGFTGGDLEAEVDWTPALGPTRPLRLVSGVSALVDRERLPSRLGIAKQETEALRRGEIIPALTVRQEPRTFFNAGAFLQGLWSVLADGRLSLTGGARYDQHNVYGRQLSGRVGLVAQPVPGLHAKLLYGNAFKAPSPLLLHAVPSAIGDVTGNPGLQPQFVHTAEAQLAGDPHELVSLSSALAYSVLTDKTEFVQQGINNIARNVARAATLSWESRAELKYQRLYRAYASYELQRTVRETGQAGYSRAVLGSAGDIYPASMLHAGLVAQPYGWYLRATVQGSRIGARRPSDTNVLLNGGVYRLPPYFLLGASVSTVGIKLFGRPEHDVSFSLTGKNLLGSEGPAPGFAGVDYPLAPRSFLLQTIIAL